LIIRQFDNLEIWGFRQPFEHIEHLEPFEQNKSQTPNAKQQPLNH